MKKRLTAWLLVLALMLTMGAVTAAAGQKDRGRDPGGRSGAILPGGP